MNPKLQKLARELYRRRGEGVIVPFVPVKPKGWSATPQTCHANVDRWVLEHIEEGCTAVRGWVYFEVGGRGCPSFLPHSVVQTADGKSIDITPSQALARHPFIRDKGRPGEFARLLERHALEYLDYREP